MLTFFVRLSPLAKFFLAAIILFVARLSYGSQTCSSILAKQASISFGHIVTADGFGSLQQQPYIQERNLDTYNSFTRYGVSAALKKDGIWLDAGSGNGFAIREYLENTSKNPALGQMSAIGVVYEKPPRRVDWENFPYRNRMNWFEGRKIEDIPNAEFGQVDVITDILGPFVYSPHPDQVLQKYLEIAKPAARIFLSFQPKSTVFVDGKEVSFEIWLTKFIDWKGATLIVSGGANMGGVAVPRTLSIELNSESKSIRIPELLRHEGFDGGSPPVRIYTMLAPR